MTPGMEPDLLEFFTEDLQKETADFTLPGIPNPVIETCKAPSLIAFDLYRHNRLWEGLPGTVWSKETLLPFEKKNFDSLRLIVTGSHCIKSFE